MKTTFLLIAFVFSSFIAGCGTFVQPGQMALRNTVLRSPALHQNVSPDGFYWQWPWNDMIAYDVTLQSRDEDIEILTADDLHVPTTVTVTFRPKAEELYLLHTEIGPTYYEDVIKPSVMTLVRSEFSHYEHNQLAKMSPKIETEVLKKLVELLKGKPIQIDHIAIKHIRFEQRVTKSVSEKLAMEQLVDQKRFELDIARQEADIARTQAEGESDAIRIRADGEGKAIIIKGRAQAEAQEAIAKTLTPLYIQFKAFDGKSDSYYFIPTGKDGLPLIVNAGRDTRH